MAPETKPIDPASMPAGRILVMVPHPDDESLGCGGLVASLAASGRRFHFVFVTDGGASHRASRTWPRERVARQREQEAVEALSRLGAGDAARSFLRLPDAGMPSPASEAGAAALAALSATVRDFEPELAVIPWRRDPHCDHRDTWILTHEALAANRMKPEILEYAIWLDELGAPEDHPRPGEAERVLVDIGPVVGRKRHAVAAHVSQTTDLICDDPEAFRLTEKTVDRLTQPFEVFWRPVP